MKWNLNQKLPVNKYTGALPSWCDGLNANKYLQPTRVLITLQIDPLQRRHWPALSRLRLIRPATQHDLTRHFWNNPTRNSREELRTLSDGSLTPRPVLQKSATMCTRNYAGVMRQKSCSTFRIYLPSTPRNETSGSAYLVTLLRVNLGWSSLFSQRLRQRILLNTKTDFLHVLHFHA